MGKRSNRNQNNQPAAAVETAADTATVETAADNAAVETPSNDDDAVLAALEMADESPFETVETVEAPTSDEPAVDEDTAEEPVVAETTEDVDVELDADDEEAILAAAAADDDNKPAATPRGRKKAAAASTAAPAVQRQFCDVADHLDPASLKTALDGINAKKVAEKAQNLIQCIETGKKLSGFTKLAVKTLTTKGRVTSKDLVEAFQADGKSLGTARAQSQQMTSLFKQLGIATQDPNEPKALVPADNALVKELALLAA